MQCLADVSGLLERAGEEIARGREFRPDLDDVLAQHGIRDFSAVEPGSRIMVVSRDERIAEKA